MVYMEYETDFEINEDYRHYAIANESFSLEALKDDVYWEIFDHIYNV